MIRRAFSRGHRTAIMTVETIKRDLAAGGFTASPEITTLASRSHAASCDHPAIAYCQGTPCETR